MELVSKLDDFGLPAWIGLMVLGFVLFWPVGLAILAYLIWSGRMGCNKSARNWRGGGARFGGEGSWQSGRHGRSSGNRAFDEYREETLKRLEEEQKEFGDFLEKLRMAKDKAEFEQFMTARRATPTAPPAVPPAVPGSGTGPGGGTGQ